MGKIQECKWKIVSVRESLRMRKVMPQSCLREILKSKEHNSVKLLKILLWIKKEKSCLFLDHQTASTRLRGSPHPRVALRLTEIWLPHKAHQMKVVLPVPLSTGLINQDKKLTNRPHFGKLKDGTAHQIFWLQGPTWWYWKKLPRQLLLIEKVKVVSSYNLGLQLEDKLDWSVNHMYL